MCSNDLVMAQSETENSSNSATSTIDDEQLSTQELIKRSKKKWKTLFISNLLLILMVTSIVFAIALGIGLRQLRPPMSAQNITLLKFPGELLIRVLQLLVLPLIVSTLISGVATLGTTSGKVGLRALVFYAVTTASSVLLGMALISAIRPGCINASKDQFDKDHKQPSTLHSIMDVFRNLFPNNIITACFTKTKTSSQKTLDIINSTYNVTGINQVAEQVAGFNILGLVVISVSFGITISNMGKTGQILKELSDSVAELTIKLATAVIWCAPIGILCLIAGDIIDMPDPAAVSSQLGLYVLTAVVGMGIHGFVVLPFIYFILLRKNPYAFIAALSPSFFAVWGTTSSAAVIPITYQCLESKGHVDHRVSRFVIPVGATMNMNGMALYEAVACMFIAQLSGYDLSFGKMLLISLTATVASIGGSGAPQGIVTMINALTALGLPTDELPKLLAIDWLLDRMRDTVSILGDCMCAAIVQYLSRQDLEKTLAIDNDGTVDPGDGFTMMEEVKTNGHTSVI